MSDSDTQIVALFEHPTDPMSVEDIASVTGLMPEAIKMTLLQHSKRYNALQDTPALSPDETFSAADDKLAAQVMKGLLFCESPQVAFRAAKHIMFERKGRYDVRGAVKTLNVNVNIINAHLKEIEEAEKRAMAQVIDINPEHKPLQLLEA